MKKLILIAALAIFAFTNGNILAKEWHEVKGTLHQATVGEYLAGDPADILSTTGDWVTYMTSERERKKIRLFGDGMDTYKEGAIAVYQCIKQGVGGIKEMQNQKAVESAVMCMALLKDTYPWMLTREAGE